MQRPSATGQPDPAHPAHRTLVRHLPTVFALLAIGGSYALISEQLALGPRGLIPGLLLALVALLLAALRNRWLRLGRTLGLTILAVVTMPR